MSQLDWQGRKRQGRGKLEAGKGKDVSSQQFLLGCNGFVMVCLFLVVSLCQTLVAHLVLAEEAGLNLWNFLGVQQIVNSVCLFVFDFVYTSIYIYIRG